MSWTRVRLISLAVCALLGALLTGATGCGSGDAREGDEVRPSPVGKVLKNTDEEGRHYREVDKKSAPEVAIEIQPDADDGWDVRLTVHHFRFSPAGKEKTAEPGLGYALLRLDDRPLSVLRGPDHHLAGHVVPRGTHQVTVRLHADDDTVWAVDGKPVGSTADITVSDPGPTHEERTTTDPPPPASASGGSPPPAYTTDAARPVTSGMGAGG
ncbi:nuclear transport factor 2 family protein [Streptomyces sp. NPDC048484]|uniref:nuclear transport factor 2 family protein n=1 Tax=Streptomyces sp. NPDC048484 TaxID=3155146 RepID=UPI00343A9C95